MESELAKFRKRKQLERNKEEIKEKVQSVWNTFFTRLSSAVLPDVPQPNDNNTLQEDVEEEEELSPRLVWLRRSLLSLTWLLFFIAFLKIEFGAVYFTISLLIIIYWNTTTSRRKEGEVSAYSVFNKGCESIDGTLKGEHLEKSLLYRSTT